MANYINNAKFLQDIVNYKKKLSELRINDPSAYPKIPDEIGYAFIQIANRLSFSLNFINYSYKEDMISDGIENAVQAFHNFDPEKSSNPFAYFTQVIYFAFIRRIQKEKKQMYVKYKIMQKALTNTDLVAEMSDSSDFTLDLNSNDQMDEFIKKYEEKLNTKLKNPISKKQKPLEKFYEE